MTGATIEKRSIKIPSCDGVHRLSGVAFIPEGEIKGFFHVVHGMTEHIGRYERFMEDVASLGYLCFGYDNLGHGMTAVNDEELGYIARKNGWELIARDVKSFSDGIFAEFGKNDTQPYILMGHSMGSFIVRYAAEKYVKPDRLIVMGTGGANPAANAGLAVIGFIKGIYGEKHFSPLVDKLAFGSYNKRFGGGSESDPKPWLTNDASVRERYYADKYCSFNFTVSAMGDLIRIMKYANRKEWYGNIPSDMPILLVSGENDPVGDYGRGVREAENKLLAHKKQVSCIIYEGARHEILNDFCYDRVRDDIFDFCQMR